MNDSIWARHPRNFALSSGSQSFCLPTLLHHHHVIDLYTPLRAQYSATMPPFGFRKRERSASPAPTPPSKQRAAATVKPSAKKGKPSLFETADASSKKKETLQENRKFLDDLDDEEEDSALSDVDSDEFEDVPPAKRRKVAASRIDIDGDDDEDEMDWEDAIPTAPSSAHATPSTSKIEDEIADVSVSMNEDGTYIQPLVSAATGKKGPSKRDQQIRVQTHCLHVMALMWHNTIRNSWLNDKEVQKILVDGLPDGVQKEVKKWKDVMRNLNGECVY